MVRQLRTLSFATICLTVLAIGFEAQTPQAKLLFETSHGGGGGCDPFFQMTSLMEQVSKEDGSVGLVIVYDGDKDQRYGNLSAFVKKGDKFITEFLKYTPERIKFVSAKGKTFFHEQFWLIPRGAAFPEFERASFDPDSIGDRYFFSNACLICEPSYPWLTQFQPNFEEFADILRKHTDYLGEVDVFSYNDLATVRRTLTHDLHLARNRYRIRMIVPKNEEDMSVNLYLLRK